MNTRTEPLKSKLILLLGFLFATSSLHAQFQGGGFPGFGNFGGGNQSRGSSSTTRQYPNNGVGNATFAIDPETRSIIVSGDEDTLRHISQVVSNLDRPKPQVLIKVVFLEVR